MSENDIIAEYIKEKYPELLKGPDFAFYRLCNAAKIIVNCFSETFEKLKYAIEEYLQESEEADHE